MTELSEKIAKLEHEQWIAWATHLMSAETLSLERVERWKKLLRPYSELTESEKNDDRKWAN